jgi:hypothetical protein
VAHGQDHAVEWEEVPCALCMGNDTAPLFVARERLFGMPGEFPIVQGHLLRMRAQKVKGANYAPKPRRSPSQWLSGSCK